LIANRLNSTWNALLANPQTRRCLERIPTVKNRIPPLGRTHPFDRKYGIDTSGFVPVQKIAPRRELISQISPYTGSQPSIIRSAIAALGDPHEYSFIDMGCGKGRALVVAAEFPFRDISGVELSRQLANTARRNLGIVKRRNPTIPPFTIIKDNATAIPLPEGKLVLFMYHAFGGNLVSRLIRNLEAKLSAESQHTFVICYNPVHGDLFDASPAFSRWYAATLPYDDSELGFGLDTNDSVVIRQSVVGSKLTPHPNADRAIIAKPPWRADLAN